MKELGIGLISLGLLAIGAGSRSPEVTYYQTIAPIINAKCVPCHGDGNDYAPFDFRTYEGVATRIELIRNQVVARNMPPIWAHSDFGRLSNIDPVTDEESALLQKWIQTNMSKGTFPTKWSGRLGGPTIIPSRLTFAKGAKVRAEGLPYWSVFSIDLPRIGGSFYALDVHSKNPRSIRYVTFAIVPKETKLPSETVGSMDVPGQKLVGVWAPGYPDWKLPGDLVMNFPANSKLVAQVHYRPTGKAENGEFRVDLFALGPQQKQQASWLTLEKTDLIIPAGKSEVVEFNYPIQKDLEVISVLPEARFYASKVQLIYTSQNGKPKNVFESTRWDPYWVGNYMFDKPAKLEKGGVLTARFTYTNDESCRMNEGKKPQPVKAGPSATDEVCRMHLLLAP